VEVAEHEPSGERFVPGQLGVRVVGEHLNPLTWFLELFRYSLVGLPAPEPWKIAAAVAVSVVVFVGGAFAFQQFEREFADVI